MSFRDASDTTFCDPTYKCLHFDSVPYIFISFLLLQLHAKSISTHSLRRKNPTYFLLIFSLNISCPVLLIHFTHVMDIAWIFSFIHVSLLHQAELSSSFVPELISYASEMLSSFSLNIVTSSLKSSSKSPFLCFQVLYLSDLVPFVILHFIYN